jgi:ATP-dependent DNA helicase RecQ
LLFGAGDAAKQSHFIGEITDEAERQAARAQLRRMMEYAEYTGCRWRDLLSYFDETLEGKGCGTCDNCLQPRETYDGTLHAQKFLSCVYRISQASRFATGMNHVIDVLQGSESEKVRRWGHDRLSTFGIGRELGRPDWSALGRELIRLGLLVQETGQFPTIGITPEGLEALKLRRSIELTRPLTGATAAPRRRREVPGTIECDEALFEQLRILRKKIADERKVPAYVILGDVSLRHLARDLPRTSAELEAIPGWGAKKIAEFGEVFLAAIANLRKSAQL